MPLGTSRYFVYIAACSDGTLSVGSTSDVPDRERVHNEGGGTGYTAGRLPVHVVYAEGRELGLPHSGGKPDSRWSRAKKQALVDQERNRLHILARRRNVNHWLFREAAGAPRRLRRPRAPSNLLSSWVCFWLRQAVGLGLGEVEGPARGRRVRRRRPWRYPRIERTTAAA